MTFLLDTDICSIHLKRNVDLTHKLFQHLGRLHVSAITVGELYTWVLRAKASPQRLDLLRGFLDDIKILEVDTAIARQFGTIHAALLDAGIPGPKMDLMIAATAIVHDLTIVTHNVRDYENIPGLTIDDWSLS